MPTYDYECSRCKKGFEAFQSMKDDTFKTCPKDKCQMKTWGKGAVKRLIGTGAGLIFKGSGFYITDYRSEGYKSAAKSDTAAASTPSVTKSEGSPTPAKTSDSSSASTKAEGNKTPPAGAVGKANKAATK